MLRWGGDFRLPPARFIRHIEVARDRDRADGSRVRALLKSMLFGRAPRRRRIWFGAGRGVALTIDPRQNLQRLLGLAEREVESTFVGFARKSASLLDVGASDGWYGLLARRVQPELVVRAFEPLSECGYRARADWLANGHAARDLDWRSEAVGRDLPLAEAVAGLPEPVLIKIDIEGGEGRLLAEACGTLPQGVHTMLIETHSQALEMACKEILRDLDFRSWIIDRAPWRRLVPERRDLPHNRWLGAQRNYT